MLLSAFIFFTRNSSAKIIETVNISRRTPPPVPTAPRKPEPPTPPSAPTPPGVPTPHGSNTPTPTSTTFKTPLSCSGDQHLDASGTNCVSYQLGGSSSSSDSSSGGQVLGTMAGTGVAEETLFNMIFTLGSLLTAFGIKKSFKITEK